jgi:hypothetical protein
MFFNLATQVIFKKKLESMLDIYIIVIPYSQKIMFHGRHNDLL